VRYGSIGGLEYEVPQSRLYCLCINAALLDGLAMYLSCDTKKFHYNESTHILHNFWTSTHRGEASPLPPSDATVSQCRFSFPRLSDANDAVLPYYSGLL